MTAHNKCEQCGEWVEAVSVKRHVCKPLEQIPVAYMQTYQDKYGNDFHTFTREPITASDEPLFRRSKA